MSSEAVGWVFKFSPYVGTAFAIHLAIADSCNDQNNDEFWMRQRKLASKARTTRKTVNDVLARMVDDGALHLLESGQGTNRYRLIMADEAPLIWDKRTPTGAPDPVTTGSTVSRDVTRDGTPGDIPPVTAGDTEPKLEKPKGTQVEKAAFAAASLQWNPSKAMLEGGHLVEALELCHLMGSGLNARGHKRIAPRSKGWVEPMEAMLRIDGRDPQAIVRVIRWLDAGKDEIAAFWRSNVLAPAKLRLQWDRMQEQYKRASGPKPTKSSTALGAGTGPDLGEVLAGRGRPAAIEGRVHGNA